jgi:hypothetical protein
MKNTKNEFYYASFSVNEITEEYPSRTKTTPSASRTIDLDCSPGNPNSQKYQELDVIIEVLCGISLITVTNYSNKAVEVNLPIPEYRSNLLLPDQSQMYFGGSDLRSYKIPLSLSSYSSRQLIKEV